jgi:pimeloyl-ACP methyl ester carboxylesterase
MTPFVLVHGAWHGGWAWDRVAPELREAGATVVAPTLTDPGEPALGPDGEVGLRTHVDDVVRVLDALVDGPAILVGHSYAGLVVREAADRRPERVRRVVLVEGWAGPNGTSLLDAAPAWFGDGIRNAVEKGGGGGLIPAPHPAVFGITDPADVSWLAAKLRPQPLRTFTDPTQLSGAVDDIPGIGIYCRPQSFPFAEIAERLGYELIGVDGPHDVMVSDPNLLTDRLLAIAEIRPNRTESELA